MREPPEFVVAISGDRRFDVFLVDDLDPQRILEADVRAVVSLSDSVLKLPLPDHLEQVRSRPIHAHHVTIESL